MVCGDPLGPKAGECVECNVADDCQSGICDGNLCVAASCGDTVKNGTETDIDCGGSCDLFGLTCVDGKACGNGGDCASTYCNSAHVCASTCANGTTDALETDVDCGGGECSPCAIGQSCSQDSDCDGNTCDFGHCI